jgi:transposase
MSFYQYFQLQGFDITNLRQVNSETIYVEASSNSTKAECPYCQTISNKRHSAYIRRPKALPWDNFSIRLCLTIQRYFCENPTCGKRTFAERLPQIVDFQAQRTIQLIRVLRLIAFETSAEATARISEHLHMSVSADTIIRILRATSLPERTCPRVLGIDDWAVKRGQNYGTILIDLETHKAVELLPDRTADTVKEWLQSHPEVEIIARDRSKEYKVGINAAAPHAIQVVDRWHLYHNLRQKLEKTISGNLRETKKKTEKSSSIRQKRFELVRYLHSRGYSVRAISRALEMHRATVTTYIEADHLSDWKHRSSRKSKVKQYDSYLRKRWNEGCRNSSALWKELKQLGYKGKYNSVYRYLRRYRTNQRYSPRKTACIFMANPDKLISEDKDYLHHLINSSDPLASVYKLSQDFISIFSNQAVERLDDWLSAADHSDFRIFKNFAASLREDIEAVRAALIYPWSNGQTEGQVNRLKTIKRQMYGRANFDLLRIRVLGPP